MTRSTRRVREIRIPAHADAHCTEYPLSNFRGPFREFRGRVTTTTGLSNEVRETTPLSFAWRSAVYAGLSVAEDRMVRRFTEISDNIRVGTVGR